MQVSNSSKKTNSRLSLSDGKVFAMSVVTDKKVGFGVEITELGVDVASSVTTLDIYFGDQPAAPGYDGSPYPYWMHYNDYRFVENECLFFGNEYIYAVSPEKASYFSMRELVTRVEPELSGYEDCFYELIGDRLFVLVTQGIRAGGDSKLMLMVIPTQSLRTSSAD
jgi:hypothetical protein